MITKMSDPGPADSFFNIVASNAQNVINGSSMSVDTILLWGNIMAAAAIGILLWIMSKRNSAIREKHSEAERILATARQKADAMQQELIDKTERLEKAFATREKTLAETYEEKEKWLTEKFNHLKGPYRNSLQVLKKQNIELKETINQLMHAIKKTG